MVTNVGMNSRNFNWTLDIESKPQILVRVGDVSSPTHLARHTQAPAFQTPVQKFLETIL